MRTPLNKALSPKEKKAPSSVGSGIEKVFEVAAALSEETPEGRARYLEGIASAQEEQKRAAIAKDEAESEADFDKACNDEARARDKERFFRKQLEKISFQPRMSESEYYGYIDTIKAAVSEAAEAFREESEKAIESIIEAKAAYLTTISEADAALVALDNAANVLQSKHRYKTITYTGDAPARLVADPEEWRRHALRYGNGKAYELAAMNGANRAITAAWTAAERVEREGF